MQKKRCYTTLKNKSSKEKISGIKMLHPNLYTASTGYLQALNIYSAPYWVLLTDETAAFLQYAYYNHWDICPQEQWASSLNWGKYELILIFEATKSFFNSLYFCVSNLQRQMPKHGNLNPEAVEQWQSVCTWNSPTDPDLKF